jgi:hypothetical protein
MNQRHGLIVFCERWEDVDSRDRLQAAKYAEDVIFSDKSAVRWTSFGWEPVYDFISQFRDNAAIEADLFMWQQIAPPLPVPADAEASMPAPFEIAPSDRPSQPGNRLDLEPVLCGAGAISGLAPLRAASRRCLRGPFSRRRPTAVPDR